MGTAGSMIATWHCPSPAAESLASMPAAEAQFQLRADLPIVASGPVHCIAAQSVNAHDPVTQSNQACLLASTTHCWTLAADLERFQSCCGIPFAKPPQMLTDGAFKFSPCTACICSGQAC